MSEAVPLFDKGACVLFQGDSITDMGRGRTEDPNHLLGHGYVFIVCAMEAARFPDRDARFINRGVSGETSGELPARWQTDALDYRPDVLSLLIGVNDLNRAFREGRELSVEDYEATCDKLLTDAAAVSPRLKIILGEPFLARGSMTEPLFEERKAAMERMQAAVARLGDKHRAPVVGYQKMFDEAARRAPMEYWVWDGVHPTAAGHQLMADEWRRTYREFWGAPVSDPSSL